MGKALLFSDLIGEYLNGVGGASGFCGTPLVENVLELLLKDVPLNSVQTLRVKLIMNPLAALSFVTEPPGPSIVEDYTPEHREAMLVVEFSVASLAAGLAELLGYGHFYFFFTQHCL